MGWYGPIDKSSIAIVQAEDHVQARSKQRLLQKIPWIMPWLIVLGGWVLVKASKQCHCSCGGLCFVSGISPVSKNIPH